MCQKKGDVFEDKVDWFDDKLGFGFIVKKDAQIIYIHYKDIECIGHRVLERGESVFFEVIFDKKRGTRAKVVHTHRSCWKFASNHTLRIFLRWLTLRGSVRYMWCVVRNKQYVSMIRYYFFVCRWFEIYLHQFLNDNDNDNDNESASLSTK